MHFISVIIPTYNKSSDLECTLAGFAQQDYKNFEIVIADDGSTDNTQEMIKAYSKKLNILYSFEQQKGRASARNRGLKLASGEAIVFVDSDRIPSSSFLTEHYNTLLTNEKIVSIGSKYSLLRKYSSQFRIPFNRQKSFLRFVKDNPNIADKLLNEEELFTPDHLMKDLNTTLRDFYLYDPPDNFKYIRSIYTNEFTDFHFAWVAATTGNMAFMRKDAFDLEFDESLVGWGAEDTDYAYKLFLRDFTFYFTEGASNYHQEHPRGAGEFNQLKRNMRKLCVKYPDSIEMLLWCKALEYDDDFTFVEANQLVKEFAMLSNGILKKSIMSLLQEKYC